MYKRYVFDQTIPSHLRRMRLKELSGIETDEFEEILNELTNKCGCNEKNKKELL
jgi:hypothetical protein